MIASSFCWISRGSIALGLMTGPALGAVGVFGGWLDHRQTSRLYMSRAVPTILAEKLLCSLRTRQIPLLRWMGGHQELLFLPGSILSGQTIQDDVTCAVGVMSHTRFTESHPQNKDWEVAGNHTTYDYLTRSLGQRDFLRDPLCTSSSVSPQSFLLNCSVFSNFWSLTWEIPTAIQVVLLYLPLQIRISLSTVGMT